MQHVEIGAYNRGPTSGPDGSQDRYSVLLEVIYVDRNRIGGAALADEVAYHVLVLQNLLSSRKCHRIFEALHRTWPNPVGEVLVQEVCAICYGRAYK